MKKNIESKNTAWHVKINHRKDVKTDLRELKYRPRAQVVVMLQKVTRTNTKGQQKLAHDM